MFFLWNRFKKKYFLLIIFFSILHSFFWTSIFAFSIFYLYQYLIYICSIFLFLYLFISLPIKDSVLFYYHFNLNFKNTSEINKFLSKINNISNLEDSIYILQIFLKKNNLSTVSLINFSSFGTCLKIESKIYGKWTSLNNKDLDSFILYLKISFENEVEKFPSNFQNIFLDNNIRFIIPIIFQDDIIGVIGFSEKIENNNYKIIQTLSQRISLIFKNNMLNNEIDQKKQYFQELDIARKVEKFIEEKDKITIFNNINILKEADAWKYKYFPLLYDTYVNKNHTYVLLCHIEDSFQRSSLLHLLMIQGYFLALSKRSNTLEELILSIQNILLKDELDKNNIQLSGFIIEIKNNEKLSFCHFGKYLSIKHNKENSLLPIYPNLGSTNWHLTKNIILNISSESILFNIRDFSFLNIHLNYEKN